MSATTELVVRNATLADAERLLEIYRPYVENTAVSFEYQVPSIEQFTARVASALDRWAWVVAVREGVVIGYAYGSAHRAREAYAKSVETSAYVDEAFHRGGVAQALYTRLFDELSRLNYRSAFAGITVPSNRDASVGFHAHFGFRHIGVFPCVGYKLGIGVTSRGCTARYKVPPKFQRRAQHWNRFCASLAGALFALHTERSTNTEAIRYWATLASGLQRLAPR